MLPTGISAIRNAVSPCELCVSAAAILKTLGSSGAAPKLREACANYLKLAVSKLKDEGEPLMSPPSKVQTSS